MEALVYSIIAVSFNTTAEARLNTQTANASRAEALF